MASITSLSFMFQGSSLSPFLHFPHLIKFSTIPTATTTLKKLSLSQSIQSLLPVLPQIHSLILGVILYCVARK